jgi:hypothetical protein
LAPKLLIGFTCFTGEWVLVLGFVEVISTNVITGWATPPDKNGRVQIQVLCDAELVAEGLADEFREDLRAALGSDGRHAFTVFIGQEIAEDKLEHLQVVAIAPDGTRTPIEKLAGALNAPHELRVRLRIPRTILHIGGEKTGTTTLQRYLFQNREELAKRGVFTPMSLLPPHEMRILNHLLLTTSSLDFANTHDSLRVGLSLLTEEDNLRHRAEVIRALVTEVQTSRSGASSMIVSNEHAFSRLRTHSEIFDLRDLLLQVTDDIKIIVYIRAQHELALSLYSTALRNGWHKFSPFDLVDDVGEADSFVDRLFFDFRKLLEPWIDVFGLDSIEIRLFEREELFDGDIIQDFFRSQNINNSGFEPVEGIENRSLSLLASKFLLSTNPALRHLGAAAAMAHREEIERLLDLVDPTSRPLKPSRSTAKAFFDSFAESNEYLRRGWFPHRASLFDVDWGKFPEVGDETGLNAEELFKLLRGLAKISGVWQGPD